MRNKIIAIVMLICICISIIPVNVFAEEGIEWVKSTIKGEVYIIEYWHPKDYPNIRITYVHGGSNFGSYKVTYYKDGAEFTGKNQTYITNTDGYICTNAWQSYMDPRKDEAFAETLNLLFQQDAKYRTRLTKYDATNTTYQYTATDVMDLIMDSGSDEFENQYAEWYFNAYAKYPPIVSNEEEVEYMQGNYYVIMKQEIRVSGGGVSFDGDKIYAGKVDTCEDVTLESSDGVFVYVVISSENDEGDFVDIFTKGWLRILYEVEQIEGKSIDFKRNDYDFTGHNSLNLFYNKESKLNRYYFENLKDACKFVLYGTAGAKYQYKEIGKTHYGYTYNEVIYNNYEVGTWGITKVPQDSYPLQRAQVILRWHEENVAERPYLFITFDYYPYASIIGTDNLLRISKKLNPEYKIAYRTEENEENWDAYDRSIYKITDEYDTKNIQKFPIYSESKLDEYLQSNSWDIIFSTFSIYAAEGDGTNAGIGDITDTEESYSKLTDENGNIYLENKETGEIFKEGEEDPYIDKDGDGIYENSKGETIDKNKLKNEMEDWRNSIIKYQSSLSKVADILEDFTDILNNSKDDVKELTDLFNAFFSQLPSIFRSLIVFVILAIILKRVIRRG